MQDDNLYKMNPMVKSCSFVVQCGDSSVELINLLSQAMDSYEVALTEKDHKAVVKWFAAKYEN
jgi:hypothetical protein